MRRAWCVLLTVSCLAPSAEAATFRTDRYRIETDAAKNEALLFGAELDRFHAALAARFGLHGSGPRHRMTLMLFEQRRDYLAYLKREGINGKGSGGFYTGRALATFLRGQTAQRVRHVLRHEGFHQFAAEHIARDLPPWFNEGMAEYFADVIVGDGELLTGLVTAERVGAVKRLIASNAHVPLEKLFALSAEQWGASLNRGVFHSGPLYQQSWSVVHFLVHGEGGKHRAAFERYIGELAGRRSQRDAFRRAFDVDVATLEKQWLAHCRALEPSAWARVREELGWLGKGLRNLDERGESPRTVAGLYDALAKEGYPHTVAAKSVFDGEPFALALVAGADGLPATLRVDGPDGRRVTLLWERLASGRVVEVLRLSRPDEKFRDR